MIDFACFVISTVVTKNCRAASAMKRAAVAQIQAIGIEKWTGHSLERDTDGIVLEPDIQPGAEVMGTSSMKLFLGPILLLLKTNGKNVAFSESD